MSEVVTPGLVAELRDALRDLLVYVDDPAQQRSEWTNSLSPSMGALTRSAGAVSQIQLAEHELDQLRKRAEVVARAKRLTQ